MRRFLGLFFSIIIFLFVILFDSGGNLEGDKTHEFYLIKNSSNAKIIRLSENEAENFIYFKSNLKGECVYFYDKCEVEKLKLKLLAKRICIEKGEDFYCEYYLSPLIYNYAYIRDKKVNLHISYSKGIWTVGTPIIYGSF